MVVRCIGIVRSYAGGQNAFTKDVPNGSLRADGELAAVTFMTPADAKSYVDLLETRGLKYFDGRSAVDLVVVDQQTGLRAPCEWASFGSTHWNNSEQYPIVVCQSTSAEVRSVVVPDHWEYESSLSATSVYVDGDNIPDSLKLIRKESGIDVFLDTKTGKELYVRRKWRQRV